MIIGKGIRNPDVIYGTWEWFWKHCVGAYFTYQQDVIALDGRTTYDRSLYGKTATIDNSSGDITITYTPTGKALDFSGDATNDRVNLGSIGPTHPLYFGNATQISCVVGARYDATDNSDFPRLFDKSNGGNFGGGYGLDYQVSTTTFFFGIANDGATATTNFNTVRSLSAGEEFQFGFSATDIGSTTGGQIYINGLPVTTNNGGSAQNSIAAVTTNMAIGNWNHTTDRMWGGPIYFVYIFDAPASDAFFREIYKDPYAPFAFEDDIPLFITVPTTGPNVGSLMTLGVGR